MSWTHSVAWPNANIRGGCLGRFWDSGGGAMGQTGDRDIISCRVLGLIEWKCVSPCVCVWVRVFYPGWRCWVRSRVILSLWDLTAVRRGSSMDLSTLTDWTHPTHTRTNTHSSVFRVKSQKNKNITFGHFVLSHHIMTKVNSFITSFFFSTISLKTVTDFLVILTKSSELELQQDNKVFLCPQRRIMGITALTLQSFRSLFFHFFWSLLSPGG